MLALIVVVILSIALTLRAAYLLSEAQAKEIQAYQLRMAFLIVENQAQAAQLDNALRLIGEAKPIIDRLTARVQDYAISEAKRHALAREALRYCSVN